MIPCVRIDAASSSSRSPSKVLRGCSVAGCTSSMAIVRVPSPAARARARDRGPVRHRRNRSGCARDQRRQAAAQRPALRRAHRAPTAAAGASLLARQELARQIQVAARALGRDVVEQDRLAERRRLGQAHVARHGRVVDLAVEVRAHLAGHLLGQVLARVDHAQHDAVDRQAGVQRLGHQADRALQVRQALERVVLALHRHQHRVGGGERVQGQQAQRRRRVDDDVVVACGRLAQRRAQPALAVLDGRRARSRRPRGRRSPGPDPGGEARSSG